jgi:uncharacterized membrane protein
MTLSVVGYLLLFLFAPAAWLWLEPRVRVVNWLSPAFFSYVTGIVACNIVAAPAAVSHGFISVSVALAIPMLLLPTDIRAWFKAAPQALLSFGVFITILCSVALAVSFLYRGWISESAGRAGMAAAVYTGGSANMAAVHAASRLPVQLLPEMTMADLITSGIYLGAALSLAPFFGKKNPENMPDTPAPAANPVRPQFAGWVAWAAVVVILGVVAGSSWLIFGKLEETYAVIGLTVLGLAASVIQPVREAKGSYFTGEYLFLAFCVATGSLVNAGLLLEGGPQAIVFMMTLAYTTLLLFFLVARWLRIPGPLALITTVAGVFGPPFIGPVAQSLKRRTLAPIGMTLAVMGLAAGNLIGLLVKALGEWILAI